MAFKASNLTGLAKNVKRLKLVPSRVSTRFAAWVHAEMQRNYVAQVDPYGGAHAPLKPATIRRKGNSLILRDSSAMMASTRAEALGGAGIILLVDPPYAIYIIGGTEHMDPRPIFPVSGLPSKWRQELRRMIDEEYKR